MKKDTLDTKECKHCGSGNVELVSSEMGHEWEHSGWYCNDCKQDAED